MTEIDSEELTRFVHKVEQLIVKNPLMNEPNTKFKVITPLLDLLGWNEEGDVELEYPVRVGTSVAKVDYALLLKNKVSIFVEAKGFDTEIGKPEVEQAVSYGRIEGVKWVVVTNGKTLHILNTEWGKTLEDCLFERLDIASYLSRIEVLDLISKKNLQVNKIDRIARDRRLIAAFADKIEVNRRDIENELCTLMTQYAKGVFQESKDTGFIGGLCEATTDFLIDRVRGTSIDLLPRGKSESNGSRKQTGKLNRKEINGSPDDEVAIFPSLESGIAWIKKYNAWGSVKINRTPRFLALYVARPHSKIMYLGEIERITPRLAPGEKVEGIDEELVPGKQVIILKNNSLVELNDPIPVGPLGSSIQGLIYTNLITFKTAKTTKDIFEKKPG